MSLHKNCCNEQNTIQKDSSKSCDCNKTTQKSQSCFNIKKLPDIENLEQLAYELCKVQQGFDKCPQYYTKQNYDVLLKVLNGAFFHLYNKEAKNVKLQEDIEYLSLLNLVNNKQLKKGQEYKIIDYTFTTTQENTESAHHDFDIIVVADSEDTLNENARACKKEGDEYFVNNNLAAWELKYSIYNNKTLYTWADEENGKGVIYWLKDEFNNEAGYDFKSALFLESLQVEEISEELYSVYDITSKILDSPALTFSSENDIDLSLTSATFNKIKFRNIIPINIINGSNNNIAGGKNILKNSSNCTIKGSQSLIIDSSDIEVYGSITYILNSSSVKTGQGSYMNSIINSKNITLGNDCQYNTLDYIQYAVYGDDCTSNRLSRCKYLTLKGRCIGLKSDRTSFEYLTIGYDNTYCTLYGNHYSQSYKTFNDNALDGHDQFLLEQDKSDIPETFMKKTNLLTFID